MKRYNLTEKKFLSDQELNRLEFTLSRNRDKSIRDYLLISVALATGGRANEILALTKKDLNVQNRSVFLLGLKGSFDRSIPIKKPLFDDLLRYSQTLIGDKLFDISYPRLVQIWNVWTPNPEKTFHCLRHTAALRVYRKTKDIRLLQLFLGHANIQNSIIYMDYVYSEEQMRRLIL